METKVFFKPTDRNSFLPMQSGHHPAWLKNIPKGQLMRVKRNCSTLEDYDEQSEILKGRFREKGYNAQKLNAISEEIKIIPRVDVLKNSVKSSNFKDYEWSFMSSFHSQYKEVEAILQNHWHILCLDKTLKPVLPANPKFIYRKAPNFGDKVVKKVLDQPAKPASFWEQKGFFACRRCKSCKSVSEPVRGITNFRSTVNNREFNIEEFITCNITHVVYVLKCPCGLMYVGRTKRQLKVRIGEHVKNIRLGYKDHNVSLHFKTHHNQDPSGLRFWGIDVIKPTWRGNNMVRDLSKRETLWIYLLDTLTPKGLNVELDVNCFISDA